MKSLREIIFLFFFSTTHHLQSPVENTKDSGDHGADSEAVAVHKTVESLGLGLYHGAVADAVEPILLVSVVHDELHPVP